MEILVMSKYKNLFGAVLSTLLFSGAVIADGVTSDQSGDILTGHSSDHKDPALMNPSKAQAPDMGHTNEQNKEDILHQVTEHDKELSSSPLPVAIAGLLFIKNAQSAPRGLTSISISASCNPSLN